VAADCNNYILFLVFVVIRSPAVVQVGYSFGGLVCTHLGLRPWYVNHIKPPQTCNVTITHNIIHYYM